MGTRGFVGVSVDGTEKIAYQQFDSYPSGVGLQALGAARKIAADPAAWRERAAGLTLVTNDTRPTPEQVERLRQYADTAVSTGELTEWYVLLRNLQGDLIGYLDVGLMEDAGRFPLDSLFCEWGYLVDFDEGVFEVYKGFQKAPHDRGRFAGRIAAEVAAGKRLDPAVEAAERASHYRDGYEPPAYYEVALAEAWLLGALPDDEAFMAEIEESY